MMRADRYINQTSGGTGTGNILIDRIDVRAYDSFSLCLQNGLSAVTISSVIVLGAMDPSATFVGVGHTPTVQNFIKIPSNTFLQQSADMGASASIITSAIKNCWHYLQITGGITATSIANLNFRAIVSGFVK